MKVKDVMQHDAVYVSPNAPAYEIARLIFGHGINGLPVCEGKKVVGFITERDILARFYPSMQEYIEDPVHSGDFEGMETRVNDILSLTATDIMSKHPETITADSPLLRAHSLMTVHKVGRLPVIDTKGNLIGVISKGDIFNALIGKEVVVGWNQEEFHNWLAHNFDLFTDWKTRLANEIPLITRYLKKQHAKKILDVGCGTGEHAIALAKHGFVVVGIDHSDKMIAIANRKRDALPQKTRKNVTFVKTSMGELPKASFSDYDAAIFMGGVIAHSMNIERDMGAVCSLLNEKKNIIIVQIPDYETIFKKKIRFGGMHFAQSPFGKQVEHALSMFYDFRSDGLVNLNVMVVDSNGKNLHTRGIGRTILNPFTKQQLRKLFKKKGYPKIEVVKERTVSVFEQESTKGIFVVATK